MRRRSRQSDLIVVESAFQPTERWTRISFLDVLGDEGAPIYRLEPAYINGATLIAVWPSSQDYEAVEVKTWAPDGPTLQQLHVLQVDWPAALFDVRVRQNEAGRIELAPCPSSLARSAARSTGELGRRVTQILDRGAQALGRAIVLAA